MKEPIGNLTEAQAARGRERGLAASLSSRRRLAQQRGQERPAATTCTNCGDPLPVKSKRATRYCGKLECARLRHNRREQAVNRAAWLEVLRARTHCVVCGERIVYKPKRRRDARTCGRHLCSQLRWQWFNRDGRAA